MDLYLCLVPWENIHVIFSVKSDYETCAWWFHSLVWCVFIYMYVHTYAYTCIFDNIHEYIYILAGLSLFVFKFLTHISWIIFFLFHLYIDVYEQTVFSRQFLMFSWDGVSDSCSTFLMAPVSIREAQHNPIFPWLDSSFWHRLSPLSPANSFSSLCSFSLSWW